MNDSIKLYAPKPVRASSNKYGVKANLRKIEDKISLVKSLSVNLDNNPNQGPNERISRSTHLECYTSNANHMKFERNMNEDNFYEDFEKNIEKLEAASQCQSEIICILRSNSTHFDSTMSTSQNYFYESSDQSDIYYDARTSLTPVRPENPFNKNFEKENLVSDQLTNIEENLSKKNFFKFCDLNDCRENSDSYFCDIIGEKYDPK
jgi:hypothetical protein